MGTVVNRVQPFVISRNVNNEGNFTDYPLAGYVHEPDLSAVAGELTRQGAVLWRSFRSQGLERT